MAEWRMVGDTVTLQLKPCHHVYSKTHRRNDIALFHKEGRFFALEAWCSHMGGPLSKGDIEDYKGKSHVMCPWHGYMFDLETGKNEIGIMETSSNVVQDVYEVKVEEGQVYIYSTDELSLSPSSENSKT